METPIISIKKIGKRYTLTHQQGGYVALRDVIANIARRPFAFLKHKAKNAVGLAHREEFWALRDVNFEVHKGEVIGIIGSNGAGKSTLLKILSRITAPTEGEIVLRGRVGSLLEVGTGFHPELTGRENIFLNGAILGMTRQEIARKFDEIVAFAGIEQFLDTPVKRYSSGMYVRLAFSVAAHMEPDILIVDEVLAVGDAEFQKKCLGKMEEVTQKEGRTIIFVSHNLEAIASLCNRCVLLQKGTVARVGPSQEVIDYYLSNSRSLNATTEYAAKKNIAAQIRTVRVLHGDSPSSHIPIHAGVTVEVDFEVYEPLPKATIAPSIFHNGIELIHSYESDSTGRLTNYAPGRYTTKITIPPFVLNVGHFSAAVAIDQPGFAVIDKVKEIDFQITDGENPKTSIMKDNTAGPVGVLLEYETTHTAAHE
ncbi:MAG TPA: polysaccharide ABC transporter ATP-binding protein [Candidatus Paceibacterota bacterium]|nr:polysaccharide ABC transporter ATP-binding protein [Candidatus Paceibacterota bacterium]